MFKPRPSKRLEIHILRFHGPGNPNRDETGKPKSVIIGGQRRLRISSQCLKYWIRNSDIFEYFREYAEKNYGATTFIRTRQIVKKIKSIVNERISLSGNDPLDYEKKINTVLKSLPSLFTNSTKKKEKEKTLPNNVTKEIKKKDNKITTQALSMSMAEVEILADAILTFNEKNNVIEINQIKDVIAELNSLSLAGEMSPVLQLFGRFTTSSKFIENINCPLQVAHSCTTHDAIIEKDYWTTVDDLNTDYNLSGSAHIDANFFGSGVFYEYFCLDVPLLSKNIQQAFSDLPLETLILLVNDLIAAFVYGALCTSPKGHQTQFANHDLPEAVYVTCDSTFPHSAISAFEKPVKASQHSGHMQKSIDRLSEWINKRYRLFGRLCGPDASIGINQSIDMDLESLVEWVKDKTTPAARVAMEGY
jgi:CRISPR system Cascade subunit CasC